jgi:ribulose-5-phosphate 4-epimerase/fuculose-1-phosphate aldolase
MHLAVYEVRKEVQAIVHLHSTYAVAASCRAIPGENAIPALTSYFAMNVSRLPLVEWEPPGDTALADAVRRAAAESETLLLANHGPIVAASSLRRAVNVSEELEEGAKVWLLLTGIPFRELTPEQVARLPKP